MPAPKPVLLEMGLFSNGAGGGDATGCDGMEQSCLQKCARTSKLCVRQSPHPPCELHNLKSAYSV